MTQPDTFLCCKCEKEISKFAHKRHERSCKGPATIVFEKRVAWNKGLTKETDDRVKIGSEKVQRALKSKYDAGFRAPHQTSEYWTEERRETLRIIAAKRVKDYPEAYSSNNVTRSKKTYYSGMYFHSNWEIDFYKWAKINNLDIERRVRGFSYKFDNKDKTYFPDFYIKDLNLYVEVKGYERTIDFVKYSSVVSSNNKIIIIRRKEIDLIGVNNFTLNDFLTLGIDGCASLSYGEETGSFPVVSTI